MTSGLNVLKTIKLYMNGEFVRGESGKYSTMKYYNSDKHYAHITLGSRKDFRGAVESSHAAQPGWSGKTAYNRGQILYRMAEMMEGKRAEIISVLKDTNGLSEKEANAEVDGAIDSFVYYAGFSDKYTSLVDNINPINGPFHNFTSSEAMGVTVLVCEKKLNLGRFAAQMSAIICGGNSCIALLSENYWSVVASLGEVFATSDLPKGTINILATTNNELLEWFAGHMEVKAVSFQDQDEAAIYKVKEWGIDNMKRIILPRKDALCLEMISDYLEFKTSWHPIGF